MNVLAIDIGGTHFKFRAQSGTKIMKVPSGPKATPKLLMKAIAGNTKGWNYDHVSIGFPGPVVHNKPLSEPANLGKGWRHFRYDQAFDGKPLRMMNDAAMQALGSYRGGRMLFLGLGTGLGSAMVVDGIVQAMEIAHLPWKKGKTYEDFLGLHGLKHDGRSAWSKQVLKAINDLQLALECQHVVLGGGNAPLVKDVPKGVRLGSNSNAFKGAFMLWQVPHQNSR